MFPIHYVTFKQLSYKWGCFLKVLLLRMLSSSHYRQLEKEVWGLRAEDVFGFRSQPTLSTAKAWAKVRESRLKMWPLLLTDTHRNRPYYRFLLCCNDRTEKKFQNSIGDFTRRPSSLPLDSPVSIEVSSYKLCLKHTAFCVICVCLSQQWKVDCQVPITADTLIHWWITDYIAVVTSVDNVSVGGRAIH